MVSRVTKMFAWVRGHALGINLANVRALRARDKHRTDGRTRHILRMCGELLVRRERVVHKVQCLAQYRDTDVDELF